MNKYETKYIDQEEKELVEDIEKVDVRKLKSPSKQEQNQLRKAAKRYIEKETKINIRIDPHELEKIKARAQKEGLKYQTLIKSVLHKYITGQLVEKSRKVG
jgi:predicted DNA binding CopG/RHH family protein